MRSLAKSAGRGGALGAAAALVAVAAALALAAPAAADTQVCSPGAGAGQCSNPGGVAVDRAEGLLFVADTANNRIDVFDADTGSFVRAFGYGVDTGAAVPEVCTTASGCQAGIAGEGPGQLSSPSGIAVDNDPLSPAFGDLYVFGSAPRVQRFHPDGEFVGAFGSSGEGPGQFNSLRGIGVGPEGIVYAIDTKSAGACPIEGAGNSQFTKRVQFFDHEGEVAKAEVTPADAPCGQVRAFAVAASGDFFVANDDFGGAVRRYEADATPLCTLNPSLNIQGLGADGAGGLYVADVTGVDHVAAYDASCAQSAAIYGETERRMTALAPYAGPLGALFAVHQGQGVVAVEAPPPGPVVLPGTVKATDVRSARATLEAQVNPEGSATEFHFEYVDQQSFEAEGFASAQSSPVAPLGSGFAPLVAKAVIEGLAPETTYRFRILAEDAGANLTIAEGPAFTTLDPLEVLDCWSTGVGTTQARLHARVNPLGTPAAGYFEVVTQASFEASGFAGATRVPAAPAELDFGAGEEPQARSALLSGLSPATTYRYRLHATDNCKPDPEVVCDFFGEAFSLTTFPLPAPAGEDPCPNAAFRGGTAQALPDCRAWEMVTPVDKGGADISTRTNLAEFPARLDQSAATVPASGVGLTYSSVRAFAGSVAAPWTSQYLASRGPGGWSSEAISPPQEGGYFINNVLGNDRQYEAFSADLCAGVLMKFNEPVLAPGAPGGFVNPYRRRSCGPASYEPLITTAPADKGRLPEVQGLARGGECVAFRLRAPLAVAGAPAPDAGSKGQLYLSCAGTLRLASALPDGSASASNASAGTYSSAFNRGRSERVAGALAEDGERLYWSASASEVGAGTLYLRENADQAQSNVSGGGACTQAARACTYEVSGLIGPGAAQFWGASPEGEGALFTMGSLGEGKATLYRYDAEAKAAPEALASQVYGLLGQSEDLSRVYLVSAAGVDGGQAGRPNLYLHEEGAGLRFIAELAAADAQVETQGKANPGTPSPVHLEPFKHSSRVSPDGATVAFTSTGQPTGYDNTDASSPVPCGEEGGRCDQQVYLYRAGADQLHCVSCLRSGARPQGANVVAGEGQVFWAAAQIPGSETQTHASNVLSADGSRLFFESYDALVLADSNGRLDVYQWQAPESGQCDTAAPTYVPSAGGCIALISSGLGDGDAELVDASAEGSDVFFKTGRSLVEGDPGLVDIYDARIGGGFAPPPPPPAPCQGESCQGAPAAPAITTPSSLAYQGPGNRAARPSKKPRRCPKGKRKVRRKGKVRCVKQKKPKARKRHTRHTRHTRQRGPR
jgi:hypothetical protein